MSWRSFVVSNGKKLLLFLSGLLVGYSLQFDNWTERIWYYIGALFVILVVEFLVKDVKEGK